MRVGFYKNEREYSLYIGIVVSIFVVNSSFLYATSDSLNQSFKTIFSKKNNLSETIKTHKATVLLLYSPTCPICLSEVKTVNELYIKYNSDSIAFILIFSQKYYSSKVIERFLKDYNISIPAFIDKNATITKYFKATVTPEAILMDKEYNRIYSGKIDNLYENIGKRRIIVTEHYLNDAIDAVLKNQLPVIKRTEPIGCILNLD